MWLIGKLVCVCAIVIVAMAVPANAAEKKGTEIDGTWKLIEYFENGKPLINPENPAEGLADHDGKFQAAFCDGHAASIRRDIPKATLNALFSWNGGELVNESDY